MPGSRRPAGLVVAGGLLLLGGCSLGPFDAGDLRSRPPPDSAFLQALAASYIELGDMERDEYDWRDAARFYRRAADAGSGIRVEPEAIGDRDLADAAVPALAAARERLDRVLRAGARALTPAASAQAQAGFDCWMQEQEEGHQPADIAACRAGFEAAIAEAEEGLSGQVVVLLADAGGEVGAVALSTGGAAVTLEALRDSAVALGTGSPPRDAGTLADQDVRDMFGRAMHVEPPPPVEVRLYFETGTDVLTAASRAALPSILDLIRDRVAPGIEIAGHTDTVGAGPANDALALRRAELVRQLVLELGVPARLIRVDSFGERDPVVPTADDFDEPRNRRVEITVR